MNTTSSRNLVSDLNGVISDIRTGLSQFWNSQLRFRADGNCIHIAYPLLLNNGWQATFALIVEHDIEIVYRLTDYGRTIDELYLCGAKGNLVKKIMEERCRFFGVSIVNEELVKESNTPFTPIDIELYAECLQAISNLVFRAEQHVLRESAVKKVLDSIIKNEKLVAWESTILPGEVKREHQFDYVLGNKRIVACKIVENKNFDDFERNLEIWGFRINDAKRRTPSLKTAIVYNPDVHGITDQVIRLGEGISDLFVEYSENKKISDFLHNSDAA
jgi:hypothetical protein